jgi:hypothetical protein
MDPGIFMSVNTTRMSFRASKIAIASSAFDASIASKPASATTYGVHAHKRLILDNENERS